MTGNFTYDIQDVSTDPTLSAASFYALSSETASSGNGSSGTGLYYAAAQIRGIPGTDVTLGAWVAPVPLPAAGWLLLSGLGGWVCCAGARPVQPESIDRFSGSATALRRRIHAPSSG